MVPSDAPVFIVIDASPDALLLVRMLAMVGARALLTDSVDKALIAIANIDVCGVVLDCSGPAANPAGTTLCLLELRPKLHLVLIGDPDDPRIHDALAARATDFVPYPATGRDLGPIIEGCIRQCRGRGHPVEDLKGG